MIYEYHHLRLQMNIGRPMYYLDMVLRLGAKEIFFDDSFINYTDIYVKTSNLRFRKMFNKYKDNYCCLMYQRQIQKYNFIHQKKYII